MTSPTLEAILEAARALPVEPVRAFMLERGFDPDDGDKMVLPDTDEMRARGWGPFGPPNYVVFSKLIEQPLLVKGIK